jgi:threonine-phosphate decarboxylase
MDPDAVDDIRSASGPGEGVSRIRRTADASIHEECDSSFLDFSAIVNVRTPDGVTQIYESALATARSHCADDYSGFRATAAEFVGCEAAQVIPAAGHLAGLRLAIATTVCPGHEVLVPIPSCREYVREVRLQGGEVTFVPREKLLDTDPSSFECVLLCVPNNPTGEAHDPVELRRYADRCRDTDTPLVVDEPFIDFTDLRSMAGSPGVIACRSLSKLAGLPGLRSGFLVATGKYRERLDVGRLTWVLSSPAKGVGTYCMKQSEFVAETRERVRRERDRLAERLGSRFDVSASHAPFLLLEPREEGVDELLSTLRESGILVRDARSFHELDNHVRVTVRSREENDRLLDALGV